MKRIPVFLVSIIISLFSITSNASGTTNIDSVNISVVVNDFYKWYLTAINENLNEVFQPRFASDINGMTTIDYIGYTENLLKHHFSDSLVLKEKQSYKDCINKLSGVKFSDFGKTVYVDLDEYENSNCDFSNYYRWIGGQDPIDGINIIEILIFNNQAKVKIQNYSYDFNKKLKTYFGENSISLIKVGDQWKINEVESWVQVVHKK